MNLADVPLFIPLDAGVRRCVFPGRSVPGGSYVEQLRGRTQYRRENKNGSGMNNFSQTTLGACELLGLYCALVIARFFTIFRRKVEKRIILGQGLNR